MKKKKYVFLLLMCFISIVSYSQENTYEQRALDYFIDSIFSHHKGIDLKILFDGEVQDEFITFDDLFLCFYEHRDYFRNRRYISTHENTLPLNVILDFESIKENCRSIKKSHKRNLKKDKYIMTLYRATQYNERIYILIEIRSKYVIKYYDFEFDAESTEMLGWCFVG